MNDSRPTYIIRLTGRGLFPMAAMTRLRAWPMSPIDMLPICRGERHPKPRDVWLISEYKPSGSVLEEYYKRDGWKSEIIQEEPA